MWHAQTAAVTGRSHRSAGQPCQDRSFTLSENGVTAIALSDGAGSCPLSQEGAQCAVYLACKTLCERFDELALAPAPVYAKAILLREVLKGIRGRAKQLDAAPAELACTLLAVAVRGHEYLAFHAGDGVIGCQCNGRLLAFSKPENGEFANTTVFVTSADVISRAKMFCGTQSRLEGFFMMSDGCEAALYQKKTGRVAELLRLLLLRAELLAPQVSTAQLQTVLARSIAQRTGDDCSIALLSRKTENFGNWQDMTQRDKARVLGITSGNRSRRRHQIRHYTERYAVRL